MEAQSNNEPRKESTPMFDDAFEKILQTSPIIDSGKDGIILKLDSSKLNEATVNLLKDGGLDLTDGNFAVKVLKIYRPGAGKVEFDYQERAYNLLRSKDATALVPKPIILKIQHLSDSERDFLNRAGGRLDNDAEIMLMDYIEGKDIATLMYDFVMLQIGHSEEMIESLTLTERSNIVGQHLNFRTSSDESTYGDTVATIENANKLIDFLQKKGFKVNESVLIEVENALTTLEGAGIFHNDLSDRNVMIGLDGKAYIIDFGRTTNNKEDHAYDDHAIIRRLKLINAGKTVDQESLRKESNDRLIWSKEIKNQKWIETIQKWVNSLDSNHTTIENMLTSALSDEVYLNQVLSAIADIVKRKPSHKKTITKIIQMVIENNKKNAFAKSKLTNFMNFINSLN